MCKFLVETSCLDVQVDAKDRLGKTVLHLACQLGLAQLTVSLLDLGADPLAKDIQGDMPIHYAIEYKQPATFGAILNWLLNREDLFDRVNVKENQLTLASHCVVNQSWHCFADLMRQVDLERVLRLKPELEGPNMDKLPF